MECGWDHDLGTKIRQNGFLKDGLNKIFLYFLPIRRFWLSDSSFKSIWKFFWENSRVSESIFFENILLPNLSTNTICQIFASV